MLNCHSILITLACLTYSFVNLIALWFYAIIRCYLYPFSWPWFTHPPVNCSHLFAFHRSFERTSGLYIYKLICCATLCSRPISSLSKTSKYSLCDYSRREFFVPCSHCSVNAILITISIKTITNIHCSHLLCFSLIFWSGLAVYTCIN